MNYIVEVDIADRRGNPAVVVVEVTAASGDEAISKANDLVRKTRKPMKVVGGSIRSIES